MPLSRYEQAHRYDGVALENDRPASIDGCSLQERDKFIIRDVWRYKFLTSFQIAELHWPTTGDRAAQRRLAKLCAADFLERFRPYAQKGSFPWTYRLGAEGHRLLQELGHATGSYKRREVFDYGHVLHEIQLNSWVLAYRECIGPELLEWSGEQTFWPPGNKGGKPRLSDARYELRDPTQRPVRPDAVLRVATSDEGPSRTLFVEFDRTRRVDKNFDKFRRYDCCLSSWWLDAEDELDELPFVLFVCRDEDQRHAFLNSADLEVTGTIPERSESADRWPGRRRILFALEPDMYKGDLEARRTPARPASTPGREDLVERVQLPH